MAVVLHTSFGPLEIRLYWRETPKTCRNFMELSKSGYYDGMTFHRVIPDFMAQTGDPSGDGAGGESIYGGDFEDEIVSKLSHDAEGVVAMANTGVRNANSSQFFITLRPCPKLDGKHTIFGRLSPETISNLKQFAVIRTKNKRPVIPVKIFSCEITEDPWEGQPLPQGAHIPDKPLIGQGNSGGCGIQ
ncbi:hypothetical protein PROFUN_09850 [Planoprotostelium fungivorum]|uniref:Peptidyl-prolyl cis-trans isomerase n=1 Tax=Planoprotostelium fungivorum TaxID=1890364 RepID=A0A2P6NFR6_9EUKA|nr:hypothetical protein PROFUN_09850 [Planoprotostelium fungivorum]